MTTATLSPAASHAAAAAVVTETDVLIVGAGFAGIGMGIRLARDTTRSFLILERANDVGGTWRDNTYPGVACDIPSHLYSFSFRPKADWSRFFAPGAEILDYLRDCVRTEGLTPHLRLGTTVHTMQWKADASRWQVATNRGTFLARTLIMAAGRLSEPQTPAVPGLDDFEGLAFHSSRWPEDLDLTGKRVGVVGSGASAVQLLPSVVATAASTVVFQRSAAYVLPRTDHEYSPAELRRFERDPEHIARTRSRLFWDAETGFAARIHSGASTGDAGSSTPAADPLAALRSRALDHLAAQVGDERLRAQLTPTYEIGCKRVLFSNDYYPALSSESVTVEPALSRVDGSTVYAEGGTHHDLDVLILATGFESTRPPYAHHLTGRDGQLLADRWHNGMTAYASTAVHGFPNLFIIDGPNASLGHNSAVFMIETQVAYILGALAHIHAADATVPTTTYASDPSATSTPPADATVLEVSAEAEAAYVAELDRASGSTVWLTGGCDSWYVDPLSRRLTLLWPDFAHTFRQRLGTFDPQVYGQPARVPATRA